MAYQTERDAEHDPNYKVDWANEAHPYSKGFAALAGKFATPLGHKFTGRI